MQVYIHFTKPGQQNKILGTWIVSLKFFIMLHFGFLIMLKYRYLFMLHSQICLLYMWVTNLSSFPTFNQ